MSPSPLPPDRFPQSDEAVASFIADLGLPGIIDIHVHAMPERLQEAVWRYFDGLSEPPWPITYRDPLDERSATLRSLGVVGHTALAYAHREGMLDWLNDFTLGLAEADRRVIPTFTIYPEPGVTEAVERALARGGAVCKVHTQVSRYHLTDPALDDAWRLMAEARTLVVAHVSAVYGVDGGEEFCGGAALRALKERHPDVRVVVAHLGMPDPDGEMWDAIATLDDVWTDVSMALTDPMYGATGDGEPLAPASLDRLRGELADRLIFGSDFPTIPHAYAAQVRGLASLALDEEGLRAVLFDRAAALLADAGWTPRG